MHVPTIRCFLLHCLPNANPTFHLSVPHHSWTDVPPLLSRMGLTQLLVPFLATWLSIHVFLFLLQRFLNRPKLPTGPGFGQVLTERRLKAMVCIDRRLFKDDQWLNLNSWDSRSMSFYRQQPPLVKGSRQQDRDRDQKRRPQCRRVDCWYNRFMSAFRPRASTLSFSDWEAHLG